MLSKRSDAFEDVASEEADKHHERYNEARDLLEEQTARLLEGGKPSAEGEPLRAHHSPHNPHWRGLSSAARRLIRAQEKLEEPVED